MEGRDDQARQQVHRSRSNQDDRRNGTDQGTILNGTGEEPTRLQRIHQIIQGGMGRHRGAQNIRRRHEAPSYTRHGDQTIHRSLQRNTSDQGSRRQSREMEESPGDPRITKQLQEGRTLPRNILTGTELHYYKDNDVAGGPTRPTTDISRYKSSISLVTHAATRAHAHTNAATSPQVRQNHGRRAISSTAR